MRLVTRWKLHADERRGIIEVRDSLGEKKKKKKNNTQARHGYLSSMKDDKKKNCNSHVCTLDRAKISQVSGISNAPAESETIWKM